MVCATVTQGAASVSLSISMLIVLNDDAQLQMVSPVTTKVNVFTPQRMITIMAHALAGILITAQLVNLNTVPTRHCRLEETMVQC